MKNRRIYFAANIPCFPRRLEDVFSVTLFIFQDLFKTPSSRLQDVVAIRLPKTSSRRLQDVLARRLAIMSSRRLQDVFAIRLPKTSLIRLPDVLKTPSVRFHQDEWLLGYIKGEFRTQSNIHDGPIIYEI